MIKKNLNSNIKQLRSEQFTSNPDYSHPQHNYFLFTGPPDKLVSFVKSMHLLPFVKDSIYPTLPLEEYGGGKLWDVDGFRDYPKDANIRERFKVTSIKKANYAAYFNSGKENNVFNNPDNNWNGKITATLKGDSCILFIEELRHPNFLRIDTTKAPQVDINKKQSECLESFKWEAIPWTEEDIKLKKVRKPIRFYIASINNVDGKLVIVVKGVMGCCKLVGNIEINKKNEIVLYHWLDPNEDGAHHLVQHKLTYTLKTNGLKTPYIIKLAD